MATFVALSFGGNIGDVAAAFDAAVAGLEKAGLRDVKRSTAKIYPPVDCHPGTPDFLNMAASGWWGGSPEELRAVCVKLEQCAGRPEKHDSAASRTLDLDIVVFGDELIDTDTLRIPHPKARERLFVLEPLAEIAGDLTFPETAITVTEVLAGVREGDAGL